MADRCIDPALHSIPEEKLLYMFNGPLSGTTRVSQYQKGKTNLDFAEARHSEGSNLRKKEERKRTTRWKEGKQHEKPLDGSLVSSVTDVTMTIKTWVMGRSGWSNNSSQCTGPPSG